MGINGRLPAFWALPNSFLGGATAAACIGAINCIGNLGGFVGPSLLGYLSGNGDSYRSGVLCLTGASFLAAILLTARRKSLTPGT